jgi:hypothetical protein
MKFKSFKIVKICLMTYIVGKKFFVLKFYFATIIPLRSNNTFMRKGKRSQIRTCD